MAEFKQIIDDALDILKFDGAVQDTLAELREKWGAQVPALLDERFDAIAPVYICLQIKLYNFSKTWSRTQKSLTIWRGFGAMDRLLC